MTTKLASFEDFQRQWREAGELVTEPTLSVAWRRYQHVSQDKYKGLPEHTEPSLEQLKEAFRPLLGQAWLADLIMSHKYLTLPASTTPWTATGIHVLEDQAISVFATGRTWRSRMLDLYLPPQFNLWYKIGINGSVFNSTHATRTFKCINGEPGELYIANQFPGMFQERYGGRVSGDLSVYNNADGKFELLIIRWRQGATIEDIAALFDKILISCSKDDYYGLVEIGSRRMHSDYFVRSFPAGWKLLWFLGVSEVFFQEQGSDVQGTQIDLVATNSHPAITHDDFDAEALVLHSPLEPTVTNSLSQPVIRCKPNHTVGILQKDIQPPLPLNRSTSATWSWNITALPSRLREDTSISHDYLSLAFEFENGRDITYTWSWELPVGFGYECPLAAWKAREYHVVIRSGTKELGTWLDEKRNIYEDYFKYVNAENRARLVPEQIVRVWLIAGNRWQRHEGEMLIKQIHLQNGHDCSLTIL